VLARGRARRDGADRQCGDGGRTFIEWDKDDIDTLGLMKVDVLALGMLTCIRKGFDLLERHGGVARPRLVPRRGPAVYAMLQQGRFHRRLPGRKPRADEHAAAAAPARSTISSSRSRSCGPARSRATWCIPISGAAAARSRCTIPRPRRARPADELKQVLHRTLGVPLFQEQAMKIAMVAARFSPEEANGLRRAMATFRHVGTIHEFEEKMVGRMVARGYDPDFARAASTRSRVSANTAFPKATPPPSPSWSMSRAG
jgi:error-prone DNA polymerase